MFIMFMIGWACGSAWAVLVYLLHLRFDRRNSPVRDLLADMRPTPESLAREEDIQKTFDEIKVLQGALHVWITDHCHR